MVVVIETSCWKEGGEVRLLDYIRGLPSCSSPEGHSSPS